MLIYDRAENRCAAFEIKHSRQAVPAQARHLRDEEKQALTQRRFGELAGRYVLYLGEDVDAEDGVRYRSAEKFLNVLPEFTLTAGMMEETGPEQAGGQGFHLTM